MPTKKTAKAAEAEETKPKKPAAKKAAKTTEKAEPKPKAEKEKKAKAAEPEAAEPAPKKPVKSQSVSATGKAGSEKKVAKAEAPSLTPHAAAILSAIAEGRAVEFIFEDSEANAPRTFEPRQLLFDALAQAWYAWGWDRRYNAERFHCLDLLKEINAVDGVGRSAQGPYKEGTPGNLIGGWLGGDPIPVKVLLHKQWVFAVKQAPPAFPDFKLEEKEEGKAQVSLTATDLRAIARWAMQFGDGITILEPARLLDRVRQAAMAWGAKLPAPKAAPLPPPPAPRAEHRPEPRHEHREARHHDEPRRRDHHEDRAPKEKDSKLEVRIERL